MKPIGRMFPKLNFLMIFLGRKLLEKIAATKAKEASAYGKREDLVSSHKAWFAFSSERDAMPEYVLKTLSVPLLTKPGYLPS
jgi:hypothetical protein